MNLDELAQKYGGSPIQTGASKFDELANKYGGTAVEQPPPAPVAKERTVGEAFKDVGAGLVSGAGSLVQLPGQLYGLATGNFSKTGALGLGEDISNYGEEMKSAGLKAREADRAAKVQKAEQEGQFAAFKAGFGETITDPALFTSFIAEQVPNIIPMILTGGASAAFTAGRASAAALAKGATKEAAAAAGKSAGVKAGTTAAYQTGAVMQGADIGAGSYDEIYNELRAKGVSEEEAATETINKARAAGVVGYGLSVLANRYLPGGKALEEILAGKKITGSRIGSGVVTGLKEIPSENIEEVGGRIAQNVAAQQAGLDRELLAGTGETAALATIGAVGIGGAAGALAPRQLETAKTTEAAAAFQKEEDEFRKNFGATEPVAVPQEAVAEPPTEFPGGYTATRREVSREDVPESFGIFAEGSDKPLTTVTKQEEADAKLQSLSQIRQEEQARLLAESEKITKSIFDEQRKLEVMEATGQTESDQYIQAKALLEQRKDETAQQIADINDKILSYSAPLKSAPIGVRTDIRNEFNVNRGTVPVGTFSTLEEVEASLRERDPEPFKQAEVAARKKALDSTLRPLIAKFNLGDVGLNVVDQLERNAGGRYLDRLIEISLQEANPIQTMRHESMHALKDLGFFTPQQWKALTERANSQWIKEYMEGQSAEIEVDGKMKKMSRLDAYKQMGLTQEEIVEEAIADAFGAYDKGATPPPGMIAALFKKLKDFFMNFGQALRGAGFESSEDIFQRVERGELKSRKPKAEKTEAKEKFSLVPEIKKEKKKNDPNDVSILVASGPYDDAALRILKSQIVKTSSPLEVDELGALFDKTYLDQFKQKGNWKNETNFKTAVAQAVKELNFQIQQSKSGLDWYDQDIADAFELTQKYIPSLKKPQKRALFSVIAGIMSPGVNARDNWVIAAQAYQHYEKTGVLPGINPATGGLWQGGLESANKKKQLDMLNAMLQPKSKGGLGEAGAVEWLQGSHTVAEITNFRARYGGMGKSSTGGKATDILPGFTAFGPKVGPFVMNINGLHEVTVDVWMTRTFNRYFGQMMGPDGKMTRSPTEPQRVVIKQLATEAAQQLGIKPYQVQSVLWFFEQQMFNKLGTGAKSYGFSDGATKFIESQGAVGVPKRTSTDSSTNEIEDKSAGKQDGRVGVQADRLRARAIKQGVEDDQKQELSFGEPAVRPSPRSGKKLSLRSERGGQREDSRFAPLALSPSVEGFQGPDPRIVAVAERFAKENGIDLKRQAEYVQVEGNKDAEDRAKRIAKAYEDMRHDPQNPEVKEAYQNLIKQTIAQYKALVDAGYKFWFIDLNNPDNVNYLSSPWNALRDMRSNKQMGIFPTNDGFGSNEDFDPLNNPLLQETEFEWPVGGLDGPKQKVLANDVFRAVHDVFGHGLEGAGFRATGEENAWQAHSRLFTGSAIKAITSETRGQNSAVNYGPDGEFNRKASTADTKYADQKVGLMPAWTWNEGLSADEPLFLELNSKTEAKKFLNAVKRVKTGRPYAFPLHVHDLDTYENARLFLSEDGESGFALIGDEIGSFFSGGRGQAYPTLRLAINEGGRRIDTYRTKLPSVMGKAQFRPVARVKFNQELATPLWDKNKFKQFQGGKPDLVFYFYDPSFNLSGTKDAGDLAVSETPLVEYEEAVLLQKEAVKNVKYSLKGITLGEQQPQAQSFNGVHYGNVKVDELTGSKYGTGIRGAERRRLEDAFDDRIKRRVYFYIPKEDGTMPLAESGLGGYVYTQTFNNILGPGQEMSRLFSQAKGDSNDFETNVIDAGYDGYAIPKMGMMVILNHNTPVNYRGTRGEIAQRGEKLSLRTNFPSVKAVTEAVADSKVPKTEEFKRFIAGNQWVDEGGDAKVFYHATAREFVEFEPGPIYLSEEPEDAKKYGVKAQDRLQREAYRALTKEEKLDFFERVLDDSSISEEQSASFMNRAKRKIPDYEKFGDLEDQMHAALLDLSPTKMTIMPLYARAETPFDFENKEHVQQVMQWVANNTEYPSDNPERWLSGLSGRIKQGVRQAIEDPRVQKGIRRFGFDSFTIRDDRTSTKSYAVYDSTQLKSVTGNLGEYVRETKDIRYSLRKVRYSDSRFDKLWNQSMYAQNNAENKTKGYLAFVNPLEFVYATSSPDTLERLRKEQEPLDVERLKAYDLVPFLEVSEKNGNWKITGHEGRHRMLALYEDGYREVPVYIYLRADDAKSLGTKSIAAENTDAMSSFLIAAEVEPLSYANKKKALDKFTRMKSKAKFSIPVIPANLQNRIDESVSKRVDKGFARRMIEAISPSSAASFRQASINRYNQMSVYDKKRAEQMGGAALLADQSAESAALMSDLSAGIAASAMGYGDRNGGIPVLRNGITTIDTSVKGMIASLAPLAASGDPAVYQRYQYWAMVKRGQRLNSQGRLGGVDSADVAFAKFLEQKHPEFVSVQKDLTAFNNGLVKYMVDTGVLSQARGAEYVKYADYIPFYRQMDGENTLGPNLFASLSGVKPPKKLKGAKAEDAPLADFLENMVRNTQSSIQAGMKNYAAQRALDVVTKVQAPGMGATRLNAVSTAPNTFNVLEKGVLVSYETPDNLLIEAVKSLNLSELPFMSLVSGPADLLRNLVTRDPGFMMANLLRDSLSAFVTSGVKMTPVVDTVMSFGKSLARKSTGFEALLNAGIIGGYEFSGNIERSGRFLSEDLDKKSGNRKDAVILRPFKSLWDALETGTTASDAATRAVIYDRVLAETGNEAEALYRALEVMNFHRKGNSALIRVLTAAVPFFNARLQGLDLFYRASTGNMNNKDAAAIKRQFFERGLSMMALSTVYYFMVSEDEEYKNQEQETKDNNWLIPSLGIRIPIPFEVGVLFKTIPERLAAYLFKDDTGKDLRESLLRNAISTFAFNPIPQTVKPIIEASFDFSTFTWRPILSEGLKDVEDKFQVGPGTSTFATKIAQGLGLSPVKVDFILKGYTGTIGMYGIDAIDMVLEQFGDSPKATKRFEQLPFIKRFTLDADARGSVTQYYQLKDAVDTVVRTLNFLEKNGESDAYVEYLTKNQGTFAFKDYIRDTEKVMKQYREMKSAIRLSNMSGDEKRDSLLEIGRAENAVTSQIQVIKKAIASVQ